MRTDRQTEKDAHTLLVRLLPRCFWRLLRNGYFFLEQKSSQCWASEIVCKPDISLPLRVMRLGSMVPPGRSSRSLDWKERQQQQIVGLSGWVGLLFHFASGRYIAECIGIRAATLAAAGVASLLNKMNRRYRDWEKMG